MLGSDCFACDGRGCAAADLLEGGRGFEFPARLTVRLLAGLLPPIHSSHPLSLPVFANVESSGSFWSLCFQSAWMGLHAGLGGQLLPTIHAQLSAEIGPGPVTRLSGFERIWFFMLLGIDLWFVAFTSGSERVR